MTLAELQILLAACRSVYGDDMDTNADNVTIECSECGRELKFGQGTTPCCTHGAVELKVNQS